MTQTPRRGRVRTGSTMGLQEARTRRNHGNLSGFPDVDGTLEVRPDGRLGVRISRTSGLKVTSRGLEMTTSTRTPIAGREISDQSTGTVNETTINAVTSVATAANAIATLTKRLNEVIRHLKEE